MTHSSRPTFALLAAAVFAAPALAAPTYLRQTRYVQATLPGPDQSARQQTGDAEFNPFDAAATLSYRNPYGPPYDDGGAASAVQRSVLSPDGIAFRGTVRAQTLASTDPEQASTGFGGRAESYLQVVFALAEPHAYALTADTDGGTDGGGSGGDPAKMCWTLDRLDFISPTLTGLTTLEDSGLPNGPPQSAAAAGTLAPGTYRLTTKAMAETDFAAADLGYHVELALSPEQTDPPAPPAMIPLPPALAAGLATLAAVGLAARRRVAR